MLILVYFFVKMAFFWCSFSEKYGLFFGLFNKTFLKKRPHQQHWFQQIRIVFDTYKEHSLKSATRERRIRGENAIKYKVSPKLDISKLTIKKLLTHIETKKHLTK